MSKLAAIIDIDFGNTATTGVSRAYIDLRYVIQDPQFGWRSIHYLASKAIRTQFLSFDILV